MRRPLILLARFVTCVLLLIGPSLHVASANADPITDLPYSETCNGNKLPLVHTDPVVGNVWHAYRVHVPDDGLAWASINTVNVAAQVSDYEIRWFSGDGVKSAWGFGVNNLGAEVHTSAGTTV